MASAQGVARELTRGHPLRMGKIWTGDFSTGDLSQWSGTESVDPKTRLMVVPAPLRPLTKALQVTLRQGDIVQNGERNECYQYLKEPDASERWYGWSTLFPTTFPVTTDWGVWTQWHQDYRPEGSTVGVSPPVEFAIEKDQLQLNTNDQNDQAHLHWTAPIPRGTWMDILFHVCWSSDPTKGFLELSINGKLVLPKKMTATNMPGLALPNYLKQGLYRSQNITADAMVWHQGMTSYDAAPAVVVVPPPPVPASPITVTGKDASGRVWSGVLTPQ
jgi:Polysaccharide lyase